MFFNKVIPQKKKIWKCIAFFIRTCRFNQPVFTKLTKKTWKQ